MNFAHTKAAPTQDNSIDMSTFHNRPEFSNAMPYGVLPPSRYLKTPAKNINYQNGPLVLPVLRTVTMSQMLSGVESGSMNGGTSTTDSTGNTLANGATGANGISQTGNSGSFYPPVTAGASLTDTSGLFGDTTTNTSTPTGSTVTGTGTGNIPGVSNPITGTTGGNVPTSMGGSPSTNNPTIPGSGGGVTLPSPVCGNENGTPCLYTSPFDNMFTSLFNGGGSSPSANQLQLLKAKAQG